MPKHKAVVLDGHTLNPGDLSWSALEELVALEVHDRTPESQVLARAKGAALLYTNKTPLRAAALQQLPEAKYIGVLATGYNLEDVKAAADPGATVSHIPTSGTASAAQHVCALLLELCQRAGLHSYIGLAGQWP